MTTRLLTGTYPNYTLLPNYDRLTITHTGYINALGLDVPQTATVANLGAVRDAIFRNGITLDAGGTLTIGNASNLGAAVEAKIPIVAYNAPVTVINHSTRLESDSQTINSTTSYVGPAIALYAGGSVTNDGDAGHGIQISGGTGTVLNAGQIEGPASVSTSTVSAEYVYTYTTTVTKPSITMASGGSVQNTGTGILNSGISITGGIGSVRNDGQIHGASTRSTTVSSGDGTTSDLTIVGAAIYLGGGGTVTNNGRVRGTVSADAGPLTVVNTGTITGAYTLDPLLFNYEIPGASVTGQNGGTVTNSGTIFNGIYFAGEKGTVTNRGVIGALYKFSLSGPAVDGIEMTAGGTVTNGTPTATAKIYNRIAIEGATGTVTNFGSVIGGYYAVLLDNGGTVTNGSAADSAAYIGGPTYGVKLAAGGTITNFGTIEGFDAVFVGAAGTLIEEGSGTLTGNVLGGGGTLELGGKSGAGTLAGLGSTISGFDTIKIDAKSNWTLSSAQVAKGSTLTDLGALTITGGLTNAGEIDLAGGVNVGTTDASTISNEHLLKMTVAGTGSVSTALDNSGTVEVAGGTLDLDGAVSGSGGLLQIDSGQRLLLGASVAATQTVDFAGTDDRLTLSDTADFAAKLSGFASGDQLILPEFGKGTTLGFSDNGDNTGTLTVTQGALQATINLLGQYAAAGFHLINASGGEIVTYTAPPDPLSLLAHS